MDSIKNIIKANNLPQKQVCSEACSIHGEYECEVTIYPPLRDGGMERKHRSICPECQKLRIDDAKSEFENRVAMHIKSEIAAVGIPKRYQGFDILNLEGKNDLQLNIIKRCQKFTNNFTEISKMGASIIFTGNPGTGKTMISLSMIPEIIKLANTVAFNNDELDPIPKGLISNTCRYANVYDIFAMVKSSYSKGSSETELDIIKRFTSAGLLVIDEVGVQSGTDFESNIIFRIINKRYEDMKPTFLISNLTVSDLEGYIGQRTVDRFRENHGAVFVFDWESHRK